MTTIINLGTGGAALNGQNGSTAGADSNDARFLDWDGENHMYLPGGINGISVPDSAPLDITGDIDLRAKVAIDSVTSQFSQPLLQKSNTNQRSYSLFLWTDGTLAFRYSTDGSGWVTRFCTVAGFPGAVGDAIWLRATFDADNGASGHDVKFFTSSDGITWTQLGSTVTTAGTVTIFNGSGPIRTTANEAEVWSGGKYYRAQIWDGIEGSGGTKVLDIDCSQITSGSATSFQALTGQTATINRSTSGRKSVTVVAPVWLFGTDDYMEVPDNGLIDFGASDSFTLVAVHRPWATQGTNDTLIAKKANTTNTTAGWSLSGGSSTALQGQAQLGDGTAGITAVSGSRTSGALTVTAAVRNVTADTLTVYLNGTAGTAITDTTTATLANSEVMRVGRLSGAGTEYSDMELVAVAVFRRALTSGEITALTTYYQNRIGA